MSRCKTRDRITSRFYWPNQLTDIEAYVKQCQSCQKKKDPKHVYRAELTPLRPTKPMELVTTDIMGPLPITKKRNRYVLVIVDHFTKYVEIFAIKTLEATEVADKLVEYICRHSVPDAIQSDQGTNFQAEIIEELCLLLDIHKVRTTPFHPEGDGISERFIRTLKTMMAHYTNREKSDWDAELGLLQFAYNTATHSTTKCRRSNFYTDVYRHYR